MKYDYADLVTSLLMALSQSAIASLPEEQKKAAHAVVWRHFDEALKDPEFVRVIKRQVEVAQNQLVREILEERKKELLEQAAKELDRQQESIVPAVVADVGKWLMEELKRKLRLRY